MHVITWSWYVVGGVVGERLLDEPDLVRHLLEALGDDLLEGHVGHVVTPRPRRALVVPVDGIGKNGTVGQARASWDLSLTLPGGRWRGRRAHSPA